MIKALFIVVALALCGVGSGYAQPASGETPNAAETGAGRSNSNEIKKPSSNVIEKREELGQKLLKRKMELDNERLNPPNQAPDRAREHRQDTPADTKGQKK